MDKDNNKPEVQRNQSNPQENEKEGNVFGKVFDKVFGDSDGDGSVSEDEDKEPGNQESIKDTEK